MENPEKDSNSLPNDEVSGGVKPAKSLTLRDYLETAADASQRTRLITIVMVVASVLVFVAVLNSADNGWITRRLSALRHKTSPYTVRKYPLLCKCDELVQNERRDICAEEVVDEANFDLFWDINKIDKERPQLKNEWEALNNRLNNLNLELENLNNALPKLKEKEEARTQKEAALLNTKNAIAQKDAREQELKKQRQAICDKEGEKLKDFSDTMQRSAAETKYTVRVPFFGVAFDINDIGIFGGMSLWIILILLRLSLRNQIVSLRIGFKEAFESDQEKDFYHILAARQTFVFPPLRDKKQEVIPVQGWVEQWWLQAGIGRRYHKVTAKLAWLADKIRSRILFALNIKEPERTSTDLNNSADKWHANRNVGLRVVPKVLSLLPFFIYLIQVVHDFMTAHYGMELSPPRTVTLLTLSVLFLIVIFMFGVWCITKWNELDKLWDYYDEHIREGRKLGEAIYVNDISGKPKPEQPKSSEQQVTAKSRRRYFVALLFPSLFIASMTTLLIVYKNRITGNVNRPLSSDVTIWVIVFTAIVSAIGTFSTIILAWRNDKRNAIEQALKIAQLERELAASSEKPALPASEKNRE